MARRSFFSTVKVPQALLEIEVKFVPPPTLVSTLSRLSPAPPKVKTFTDVYFDNSTYTLTTRDMWLRKRDATLELKWPAVLGESGATPEGLRPVDHYNEDTVLDEIAKVLRCSAPSLASLPPPPSSTAAHPVSEWLKACHLSPFASLVTHRSRYRVTLAGSTVHVDLDEVEFSSQSKEVYRVGEVELLEAAPGSNPNEALGEVLKALGVESSKPVKGKVLEYLSRHSPKHWDALEAAGHLTKKLGAAWSK